jgi:hypothetical protein
LALSRQANSLSLKNMVRVAAMIFQQILTEVDGAKSKHTIMTITKIVVKLMKQNGS